MDGGEVKRCAILQQAFFDLPAGNCRRTGKEEGGKPHYNGRFCGGLPDGGSEREKSCEVIPLAARRAVLSRQATHTLATIAASRQHPRIFHPPATPL